MVISTNESGNGQANADTSISNPIKQALQNNPKSQHNTTKHTDSKHTNSNTQHDTIKHVVNHDHKSHHNHDNQLNESTRYIKPNTLSHSDTIPASQYSTVHDFVKQKGGSNIIQRVLIANNGIAAVKAIRSIRRWSYDTFGNERMIKFIVMATPDDMRANAAYIHLADEFVLVPGGSNNNNYSNVSLIVDIAERTNADAVWPGWGHASENPKLPDALAKTKNKCIWIGPPSSAMRALGDKIGSTIIAQAAGVPCMGWSGDGLTVNYKQDGMPTALYNKACIKSIQQCREQAERVGLPIMIKASEGGGGKGIRKVESMSQLESSYQQVLSEVPGSPVFIMKLAPECRHLEAQLLADQYGDAIAIFGRDCSIQRRHQKIIEEGPVSAAPPDVWRQMELSAIRLAKEVGYCGAGTVEYLYTTTGEYYFLELNPRLQVEHPVTELVSGVNLPASQLMIAMGIPLYKIRGIRQMFQQSPDTDQQFNFDTTPAKSLGNHVIACRITAENPDSQFQPTSGTIHELNFRSSPDVWGYFSVAARGSIHEFSDSQFGHIFAHGATRELARRAMMLALKELSIRGDIRTTVEYLQQILEHNDFKSNQLSTTWLEKQMYSNTISMPKPAIHLCIILGALYRAIRSFTSKHSDYMAILERGQLPSSEQHNSLVRYNSDLIYQSTKFVFSVSKCGASLYNITINEWNVMSEVHLLNDDGLLCLLDGKKHIVYGQEFPSGLRLTIDNTTCLFQQEYDPTQLRASMQGKLVRYVLKNNTHVEKNHAYAEVEVMKMILTLYAPESGMLHHIKPEQSVVEAGELIASLTLDHPEMIQKSELFNGTLPLMGTPHRTGDNSAFVLNDSLLQLTNCLNGYYLPPVAMQSAVTALMSALRNPALPLDQVNDVLSTLIGRIPESLYDNITTIIDEYKSHINTNRFYWESPIQFPSLEISAAIDQCKLQCSDDDERNTLDMKLKQFVQLIQRYNDGNHTYAINILTQLLQQYIDIEQYFNNDLPLDTVVRNLKKEYKNNLQQLAIVASAHYQLNVRSQLVVMLLNIIEYQLTPLLSHFTGIFHSLATLINKEYATVALNARQLIMKQQMPSTEQRRIAISTILSAAASVAPELHADRLAPLIDQSQPIEDLIFQFFTSHTRSSIQAVAVEAYIRRTYQVFNITDVHVSVGSQRNQSSNTTLLPNQASKYLIKARWEFLHQPLLGSSSSVLAQNNVVNNTTYLMSKAHSYGNFGILVGQRQQSSGVLYDRDESDTNSNSDWAAAPSPVGAHQQSSSTQYTNKLPTRVGVMIFYNDFDSVKKEFVNVLSELDGFDCESPSINGHQQEPPHVIYIGIRWNTLHTSTTSRIPADELLAQMFRAFLAGYETQLSNRGVRRVTFIISPEKQEYPAYFTYRSRLNFDEDTLIRHIEPSYAHYMQLQRFANFDIQSHPTNNRMVHVFAAYPSKQPGKGLALPPTQHQPNKLTGNADGSTQTQRGQSGGVYDGRRFFVRSLIRKLDSADLYETADIDDLDLDAHPETEVAFVEALSALEMAIGGEAKKWRNNSIFLNMLVEASMTIEYIEAVIKLLARRYDNKLRRLNVSQVELSVSVRHTTMNSNISEPNKQLHDQHGYAVTHYRFVCTNPTGYILNVDTYEEVEDPQTHKVIFQYYKPQKSQHLINSLERGVWNGHETTIAYPVTTKLQQKRMVADSLDTVYVYDWLVLIESAVERSWRIANRSSNDSQRRRTRTSSLDASNITLRNVREEYSAELANVPDKLIDVVELCIKKKDNIDNKRIINLSSQYELIEIKRDIGQNDIGMVGWRITLYTPQYPHGRDVVFIANDITYQAGTFGPLEDVVFDLCSKYARARSIPRIYLAANSGARIGLAEELRHKYQIAWIDNDVSKGVDYLYLTESDYKELSKSVIATSIDIKSSDHKSTEKRYVIKNIVGMKDGLGVENLRGSGTIAGETSLAYNEIFTLTYVTSRTVGIGAYLARLGQRCIQKQTPSIILTGFNALNKLLGRTVYTSNVQLGGVDIMYTNGVSHMVVENDMRGIQQCLQWLSYVPNKRNQLLPITSINELRDTIDRTIDYIPSKSTPYDPRHLLSGCYDIENNTWLSGLFDRGTFHELLGGWARGVITGRGRIGNIPVGVIAVETRTIEQITPADPAAVDSKEHVRQLAGQVWFPDSAYKTAQCIWDCTAEDIPLIILANWRGFSGGMMDMFDQVLKFGAYIVDALRTYRQPVIVYLPPYATLRGGAWVVVDPTINAAMMEMYADDTARGGVLETDGTLEVKYRKHEILATIHRLDSQLIELDNELKHAESTGGKPVSADGNTSTRTVTQIKSAIKERELSILPLYTTAATLFADKHDTPGRMLAKGCINGIIDWKHARTQFYWRLRRRLVEVNLVKQICSLNSIEFNTSDTTYIDTLQKIQSVINDDKIWSSDKSTALWYTDNQSQLDSYLNTLKQSHLIQSMQSIVQQAEQNGSLQSGLSGLMKTLSKEQQTALKNAINKI